MLVNAYSRVVVHDLGVGLVEAGAQVSLSSGQTDGIADTLAQRTCSITSDYAQTCTV
jgi:hypothetical protein